MGDPATVRRRLDAIDVLRGFVMVVMALDHVRAGWGPQVDPTDLTATTPTLFATRWITHLCAPTFVFLAGTGAGLSLGGGKSRSELSRFLVTRGLWLVVLELSIVKLGFSGWTFWEWQSQPAMVLWALGWSMVVLAALIHLPLRAVVAFGLILVVGHNALDGVAPDALGPVDWLWQVLHVRSTIGDADGWRLDVRYPLIPWIGVMALGYALGVYLARPGSAEIDRARLFARAGLALIAAFIVLRAIDVYGDLTTWEVQSSRARSVMAFMNVTKYPPSLSFLCATLGVSAVLLAAFERWRPPLHGVLLVFGRVPLFYYVLHLLPIAMVADMTIRVRFGVWPSEANFASLGWGYSLWVVYALWLALVAALYPLCRWFAGVKARRRDWWLGYL